VGTRQWTAAAMTALVALSAACASVSRPAERTSTSQADPSSSICGSLEQGAMTHVFDTSGLPGPLHYVNDHTLIQARDGSWHLFGIFHAEPMGDDTEFDFVHAVAVEPDPAKWEEGAFRAAPEPYTIALRADKRVGESHLWAPHVIAAEGRYWMVYQGGGKNDDHASIRLAESDDLYRWSRVGDIPLFEDFCEARDPMLSRRGDAWSIYYTRCESLSRKISGVAERTSRDLVHWSEPRMALTLGESTPTTNSAFTESPFVFERGGFFYLSVTSYPLAWDATMLYRSRSPHAFADVPFTRIRAHAAEWVFGKGDRAFVTHAGPGQRGVWLSPVLGI
jgi:Glycosyl hydrolases family 43